MCGTFFNIGVDTDRPVTAFFGCTDRQKVILRFGEDPEESYISISHEQAKVVQAKFNKMFPVEEKPTKQPTRQEQIDTIWRTLDAMGGPSLNRFDPAHQEFDRKLGLAMDAIATLGGMDPAQRAALSAQPSEHLVAA